MKIFISILLYTCSYVWEISAEKRMNLNADARETYCFVYWQTGNIVYSTTFRLSLSFIHNTLRILIFSFYVFIFDFGTNHPDKRFASFAINSIIFSVNPVCYSFCFHPRPNSFLMNHFCLFNLRVYRWSACKFLKVVLEISKEWLRLECIKCLSFTFIWCLWSAYTALR